MRNQLIETVVCLALVTGAGGWGYIMGRDNQSSVPQSSPALVQPAVEHRRALIEEARKRMGMLGEEQFKSYLVNVDGTNVNAVLSASASSHGNKNALWYSFCHDDSVGFSVSLDSKVEIKVKDDALEANTRGQFIENEALKWADKILNGIHEKQAGQLDKRLNELSFDDYCGWRAYRSAGRVLGVRH